MPHYEYKVVPAPEKIRRQRGLKGPALFAHAMEDLMNEMAADGWSYLRADTLPQEERSGLTSKTTTFRNLLVFQRELFVEEPAAPVVVPEFKAPVAPPEPAPQPAPAPAQAAAAERAPEPQAAQEAAEESPLFSALRATRESRVAPATEDGKPLFPNRQGERVDL